ncbi:unnamed protein product [Prunus armeniaca]|uniref:Uncharacterized protein n=1 Tax=Prunus armeniaca TaxID=36596 RepID=A0A6J5Y9R9_PRUAR|nr:unnamed protein product [Prunus armeniaca]
MCCALHRVYMGWVHVGKEIPNQTVLALRVTWAVTGGCLPLRFWANLMPVMGLGSETLCYDGLLLLFFSFFFGWEEEKPYIAVDDMSTKEVRIKILQN